LSKLTISRDEKSLKDIN